MHARVVVLGAVVVAGLAIGVLWGWRALAVYTFFAAIAGGLSVAAAVGGEWLRDVSRRRFDGRR